MRTINERFDLPTLANMVEGGRTPVLSKQALEEIGYSIAIFPATGFLAVGATLKAAYGTLKTEGSTDKIETPLENFEAFSRLMGFERVWDFDKKWSREQ